jgi:RNA polymerase sigma factor (sigma-70 family)
LGSVDRSRLDQPDVEAALLGLEAVVKRQFPDLCWDDCCDVAQESRLAFLRYAPRFDFDSGRLRSFLWKTAKNTGLNFLRQQKRARTDSLSDDEGEAVNGGPLTWGSLNGVPLRGYEADEFEAVDRSLTLEAVRERLDPNHWRLLELRYLDERSIEEMAQHLHCSKSTAKRRLSEALTAARALCN